MKGWGALLTASFLPNRREASRPSPKSTVALLFNSDDEFSNGLEDAGICGCGVLGLLLRLVLGGAPEFAMDGRVELEFSLSSYSMGAAGRTEHTMRLLSDLINCVSENLLLSLPTDSLDSAGSLFGGF